MGRPRTNDALEVIGTPNIVTDPRRVKEIGNELLAKIAHIKRSYVAMTHLLGESSAFNQSIERLRTAVRRKRDPSIKESRLHPEVELVVSRYARQEALIRTGDSQAEVIQCDIEAAAIRAAEVLKLRRGRPAARLLERHIQALIAVWQEATGVAITASLSKNSEYGARLSEGAKGILMIATDLDPSITEIQLANLIKRTRRQYAGKALRFIDFFPAYQMEVDEVLSGAKLANGTRIERFEPNFPIRCA
jgi:hypothetical protein